MPLIVPQHPGLVQLLRNPEESLLVDPQYDSKDRQEQWLQVARKSGIDPSFTATVAQQWELRANAQKKLGDWAKYMLFTRTGLEQATRQIVARYRAAIWQQHSSSFPQPIYDLGCGLGSDALALLESGLAVHAVEIDPDTAAIAQYNLGNLGPRQMNPKLWGSAQVTLEDVYQILDRWSARAKTEKIAFWADPARRKNNQRQLRPDQWSPSLDRLLVAVKHPDDFFGIKIAPGIKYQDLPTGTIANWVSVAGDLVEACLWSPNLNPGVGARWATVFDRTGQMHYFDLPEIIEASQAIRFQNPSQQLGLYLWEPDPAVLRAGGVSRLCQEGAVAPISERLAYLTGDQPPGSQLQPFVTSYQICDNLPLKTKVVKKYLNEHRVTRVDIKKRGVQLDPTTWRNQVLPAPKKMATWEPKTMILALTRVSGKHRCLVLRPSS